MTTYWTRARWASLAIHSTIVLIPFSFSAVSAALFWYGLFQSWLIAAPLVGVLDALSLLGLVLYIVRVPSPFQALRHLLPFVSIVPLGIELHALLAHNGPAVALTVALLVTALLVAVVNLVVNFADEQSAQSAQRPRAWPAVRVPPAAVGPTTRLRCCDAPDLPDGAQYCINCGRRVW